MNTELSEKKKKGRKIQQKFLRFQPLNDELSSSFDC